MIAERGDFVAIYEPFCHLVSYGHSEVAGHIVHTEEQVIAQLSATAQVRPVFFKDCTPYAYPAVLADAAFLRRCVHTFLIRDPRDVIASHYAMKPGVLRDEIGFSHLYTLYEAVRAATGTDPVVLDADDLVARPGTVVRAWCARMGINHRPKSLNWAPGDRPEWSNRGDRDWHSEVRISTGLHCGSRRYPETVKNNPTLVTYLDHHLPYYEDLWRRRVQVEGLGE
jgi:hypothetical protein